MSENKVYMIRRRSDGLYSTGGLHPNFGIAGKMWKNMKEVNAHLSNVYGGYFGCLTGARYESVDIDKFLNLPERKNPYADCDIVEAALSFEVKEDVFRHLATRYLDRKKK